MKIAEPRFACAALAGALALAACRGQDQAPPELADTERATPAPHESATSIIRPEVASEPIRDPAPQPLEVVVPFAAGGHALDDAAADALAGVLDSEQLAEGWPIVLRGHTDSVGDDQANLRASRLRAEAVADWLVAHGVDRARLTVIALGEQRPVAPNATLDGAADEAGRAKNRRVTITIAPPAVAPAEAEAGEETEPPAEPVEGDKTAAAAGG